MKVVPLYDNVLIDGAGKVIALPEDAKDFPVKVGDRIIVGEEDCFRINVAGQFYYLVDICEAYGKIVEE